MPAVREFCEELRASIYPTALRIHEQVRPQMMLQNIEYLIDGNGDISIGRVGPIRCAATAADEHEQLAALVRRPDESLAHLLERLDAAIGKALEDGKYIDEINPHRPAARQDSG